MSLYVIGDLHLSFGNSKPMDIFSGWEGYTEKIENNWKNKIKPEDTVVLAGDTSWGMSLEASYEDFKFINDLPGKKIILKGNHDYWWNTGKKMNEFFKANALDTLNILHNNSYTAENVNICGSRGWLFEKGEPHDEKIVNREARRIEASVNSVKNKELPVIMFMHYPPLIKGQVIDKFVSILLKSGIKHCYYGHIHGAGHKFAVNGIYKGIDFKLISADFINFDPWLISL